MYRILASLCVVVTLLALAGCGGPGPAVNNTTSTDGLALTPTDTPAMGPETPTASPVTPEPTPSTATPTAAPMTETPASTTAMAASTTAMAATPAATTDSMAATSTPDPAATDDGTETATETG